MENNLYYTPTIEEFYIGFEYEYMNGDIWEESEMRIQDYKSDGPDYERSDSWFEEELLGGIRTVRVKYLDQSDIESLGWKTHNNDVFTLGKMIKDAPEDWHNLGNWKYRLMISQVIEPVDPCRIFIDNRNPSNGGANQIFRGTIKNKSELIKLMQQLNINNNVKEF